MVEENGDGVCALMGKQDWVHFVGPDWDMDLGQGSRRSARAPTRLERPGGPLVAQQRLGSPEVGGPNFPKRPTKPGGTERFGTGRRHTTRNREEGRSPATREKPEGRHPKALWEPHGPLWAGKFPTHKGFPQARRTGPGNRHTGTFSHDEGLGNVD